MSEERAYLEKIHPGAGLSAAQFDKVPVVRTVGKREVGGGLNAERSTYSGVHRSTYMLGVKNEHGSTGAMVDINHGEMRYLYPSKREKYEDVHPDDVYPANRDGQRELFEARHDPAEVDMLFATANRPEGAPRRHIVQRLLETAAGDHYRRTGQKVRPSSDLSPGSSRLVEDYKQSGDLHPDTSSTVKNDLPHAEGDDQVDYHLDRNSRKHPRHVETIPELSRQFAPLAVGAEPGEPRRSPSKKGTQLKLPGVM